MTIDDRGLSTPSLIHSQKTLVLATASPAAWAAPVYYVYSRRKFYFFSSPDSRHIRAAMAQASCAAALYRDSDEWREIEGLQMEGTVDAVRPGVEALDAFAAYVAKFPSVKEFFNEPPFDFDRFSQFFHVQLYAFIPTVVFYTNNRDAFGTRREIRLPE